MIEHLAKKTNIFIYTLSPSITFPADLPEDWPSVQRTDGQGARKAALGSPPGQLSIVDEWGRPGREYFAMLGKIAGIEFRSRLSAGPEPRPFWGGCSEKS